MVPIRLLGGQRFFPGGRRQVGSCHSHRSSQDATSTLFFDADGKVTEFVAQRHTGSSLETWSVPITAYGEFEGLTLPVGSEAVWKLADGDQEYIDVTVTELHHEH